MLTDGRTDGRTNERMDERTNGRTDGNLHAYVFLLKQVRQKCNIIFSYEGRNSLRNYILVLAKYYIYKTKFISTDKNLNVHAFESLLKKKFISDRYNAYISNRVAKFFSKRFLLFNYFISANTV